jgi:catechol 2,3-dioxygenase-like lactoylglutathione lyase family enzyme
VLVRSDLGAPYRRDSSSERWSQGDRLACKMPQTGSAVSRKIHTYGSGSEGQPPICPGFFGWPGIATTTSIWTLWNNQSRWNTQSIPKECLVATRRHSERRCCSLFSRLNLVTLWVRDQERNRQFFMEKLNFETLVDVQTLEARWIVVAPPAAGWLPGTVGAGLSGIALVVPPEGSAERQRIGQDTGFSFLTEDVRSLFQEWSRRGVRFPLPPMEPSWGSGQARYAVFEDVDGNRFSLIEFDEATRRLEAERRAQAARLEAERQAAHDLAIAKQVQTRLFPQHQPLIRTLVYAGICHPARTVGADYYDFLDLAGRRLGPA